MTKLNREQARVAIAKLALPEIKKWTDADLGRGWRCDCPPGTPIADTSEVELPDYLADLNAMHEAEKTLTHEQRGEYTLQVHDVTEGGTFGRLHATASQRAKAFLRVHGYETEF